MYDGQLNSNEIFSAIFNMIISQDVFADNIKGTYSDLADKFRVDGTLYGDTKLYYATDCLKSVAWGNDAEATNLLALHRPAAPACQAISLDQFRQISLTVGNYLSKQAFSTENAFSDFNSVMLGWIRETKKIFDATYVNAFMGTTSTSEGLQTQTLILPTDNDAETQARLQGQAIAEFLANVLVQMKDVSRDYNDYGFIRSYDPSDLMIIWNAEYKNKILKIDLPTIFNKEGLVDAEGMEEVSLPKRYFGTVITGTNLSSYSASTPTTGKPIDSDDGTYTPGTANANGTLRALKEQDIKVGTTVYHVFGGDEIPVGTVVNSTTLGAGLEIYIQTSDVMFKIVHKRSVPYMSAFEVGTSFFNPKSLTENHYLTFGFNSLDYLRNYPFVTIKKA